MPEGCKGIDHRAYLHTCMGAAVVHGSRTIPAGEYTLVSDRGSRVGLSQYDDAVNDRVPPEAVYTHVEPGQKNTLLPPSC